jgi:hypothetical protein
VFFYAWLMGWERISVYDGGWYEWSRDPRNVAVRGPRSPDGRQCNQAPTLINQIDQIAQYAQTEPIPVRCA